MTVVEIKNLTCRIFDHFTMNIEEKKWTMISGGNGSGKTTLIKLLGNLIYRQEEVIYHLENTCSNQIGIMLDEISFVGKNVEEELNYRLTFWNDQQKGSKARLNQLLKLCDLASIVTKNCSQLSLFERKKLEVAVAISLAPPLLVLDDPCADLNKSERIELLKILKNIQSKESCSIVMTTSCLEDTLFSDYVYILDRGKIVLEGKPLLVLQEEKILTRLGLALPFMIDLSLKLKFYELLEDVVLDQDRMVDILWK